MPYYRSAGHVPPKRHTVHRDAAGALLYEELVGEEGFSSDSSLVYHRCLPSALADARPWELPDLTTTPNAPLLPRHFALHSLFPEPAADVVTGRRLVLGNADVRLSYALADGASPLYRNAVGDECVFVEAGTGVVETTFGFLEFGPGDYVLLPRGTTHRWVPSGPVRVWCIEASGHIGPPKRYLSRTGQFLEHAPYCERDLRPPSEPVVVEAGETEVYVKHRGSGPTGLDGTVHVLPHSPFDVVGWDGALYPYAFDVRDFEPVTGRVHQPPPVHQVFEGPGFVVCNFVPRKVDYHPLAVPVPYYHSNVDSDEVMLYVDGDYAARKGSGIAQGSVSLHPGGHAHGPQPGAVERSLGVQEVDELAVMVDTFRPLGLGEGGRASDDGAYAWSWTGGRASRP